MYDNSDGNTKCCHLMGVSFRLEMLHFAIVYIELEAVLGKYFYFRQLNINLSVAFRYNSNVKIYMTIELFSSLIFLYYFKVSFAFFKTAGITANITEILVEHNQTYPYISIYKRIHSDIHTHI